MSELDDWHGSAVVYDPTGTVRRATEAYRRDVLGHVIRVFDPTFSGRTDAYNLMNGVRVGTPLADKDARHLAAILTDPIGHGWVSHSVCDVRDYLAAVVLHICYGVPRRLGRRPVLEDLAEFLTRESIDYRDMAEYEHLGDRPHPDVARMALQNGGNRIEMAREH